MKFSIIIAAYEQPKFLEEAIRSVYNQTYKDEFELIVVDDSVTDKVRNLKIEDLPKRPEIKWFVKNNVKNLGLQKSHNIGVYHASGEWIIRLDHDDKLVPDALQKLSDFIDNLNNHKIGFIFSNLKIMDAEKIRIYPDWDGSLLGTQNIGHLQCYRRYETLMIGGWDVTLAYSADTDFIIRMIENSVQLVHIPEVLIENRLHPEQYTQQFPKQGNDPNRWKNLVFDKALKRRPDLWPEGRQNVIMQTSGSPLWRSEILAIEQWIPRDSNLNGLDIGCSNKKKVSYAIGVDLNRQGGKIPELVINASDSLPFKDNTLDFIIGSHVVEHLENPIQTIKDWMSLLKVGGRLVLVVPDTNFTPKMGTPQADPTHKHDWVPETFKTEILDKLDADIVIIKHFGVIGNNWSFLCTLEKVSLVNKHTGNNIHG